MTKLGIALLALGLAACGGEPKPPDGPPLGPKPKTSAVAPVPVPAPEPVKAVEAPKPDPNADLATRVRRALEDEAKIQAAAIDVTAEDGRVTLWGTAADDGERARAARVASKVAGVKAVENRIAVVRGS